MGSKTVRRCRRAAFAAAIAAGAFMVVTLYATVWNGLSFLPIDASDLASSSSDDDHFDMGVGVICGFVTLLLGVTSLCALYISSCCPADSHTAKSLLAQMVIHRILSRRGRRALDRLETASGHLETAQTELLLNGVVARHRRTEFGRSHRFDTISTRDDFVAAVPLSNYDSLVAGRIGRILAGSMERQSGKSVDTEVVLPGERSDDSTSGTLTIDDVQFVACSAGTSGKNKLIPIVRQTKDLAAEFVGPLAYHVADMSISGDDNNGGSLHRVLNLSYRSPFGILTSSTSDNSTASGLPVGPISTYIGRKQPYVVSPDEVYDHVTDEPTALHVHAVFGLAEPEIGYFEALFSTLVYSFWRHVERHWPTICDQIETGRLSWSPMNVHGPISTSPISSDDSVVSRTYFSSASATQEVLSAIGKRLQPNPERAAELRRQFAKGFDGIATRIWPRLHAVRMTSTGGFSHCARRLASCHMRGVPQLSMIHAASEGYYGVSLGPLTRRRLPVVEDDGEHRHDGGNDHTDNVRSPLRVDNDDDNITAGWTARYTILPTTGFYEFIPVAQIDADQPATLFAEQVKVGEEYEMVYTAPTGMYRYRTGDVIKVVDHFNQCPVYEFQYRVGQTLNVYWEKTPESILYAAVRKTIDSIDGIHLVDYTSTEDVFAQTSTPSSSSSEKSEPLKHYVLFVEVERSDGGDVVLRNSEKNMFDANLRDLFEMYATLRATGSIGPMRVHQVARGTFDRLKYSAASAVTVTSSTLGDHVSSEWKVGGSSNGVHHPMYKTPRVVRQQALIDLLLGSKVVVGLPG